MPIELHETSTIKLGMEVVDGNRIKIEIELKDGEVFPKIDWENRRIRARLTDQAAAQLKGVFSQRFPAQGERRVRMVPVVCNGCGKPFETETPCCGEETKIVTCPHCGKQQTLGKVEK